MAHRIILALLLSTAAAFAPAVKPRAATQLRAGGDAAGRRRRGASDGHTASTASCGHCGHAGRASSAFFGVRGVLFLCKECRPAHESTVLRRHSRTD